MLSSWFTRMIILGCGVLYPAYASHKAVRHGYVDNFVNWMLYWIIFALFTCAEVVTDFLLFWVPLYYEIKVAFLLWMLPTTLNGSGLLYHTFLHPLLERNEMNVDDYFVLVRENGCRAFLEVFLHFVKCIFEIVHRAAITPLWNRVRAIEATPPSEECECVDPRPTIDVNASQLISDFAPTPRLRTLYTERRSDSGMGTEYTPQYNDYSYPSRFRKLFTEASSEDNGSDSAMKTMDTETVKMVHDFKPRIRQVYPFLEKSSEYGDTFETAKTAKRHRRNLNFNSQDSEYY